MSFCRTLNGIRRTPVILNVWIRVWRDNISVAWSTPYRRDVNAVIIMRASNSFRTAPRRGVVNEQSFNKLVPSSLYLVQFDLTYASRSYHNGACTTKFLDKDFLRRFSAYDMILISETCLTSQRLNYVSIKLCNKSSLFRRREPY